MNKLTATITLIKENKNKIIAELVPYDNDQSLAVVINLSAPEFTEEQCRNPVTYDGTDTSITLGLSKSILDLVKRTLAAHKINSLAKEMNVRERRAGMHTVKNLN